jgi:ubiquinone/menaquinone biosynthesis C-methylase UbiE
MSHKKRKNLPEYEPFLEAFHRARAGTLQRMVRDLPISSGDRVLDLACGDGAYTGWLAEAVAPGGEVIAVDLLPAYLAEAERRTGDPDGVRVQFVQGNVQRLPFGAGIFDVAWCAQSLYSLPDPTAAVRELGRVTRPGGFVAILEDDTLHQVLFPWPADLELALRRAEYSAFRSARGSASTFYIGRRLRAIMAQAGLKPLRTRVYASVWEPPFTQDQMRFLTLYLADLRKRAWPYLAAAYRRKAEALLTPRSDSYVLRDPSLSVTCMDYVSLGKR